MTVVTPLGNNVGGIVEDAETQYIVLRQKCIEQFGPDFCNSVLPRNMIYALTRRDEGYTLPWWAWMLLGLAAGRLIRL